MSGIKLGNKLTFVGQNKELSPSNVTYELIKSISHVISSAVDYQIDIDGDEYPWIQFESISKRVPGIYTGTGIYDALRFGTSATIDTSNNYLRRQINMVTNSGVGIASDVRNNILLNEVYRIS